jgi:NitT/TauT family transport system substrate-binding protein
MRRLSTLFVGLTLLLGACSGSPGGGVSATPGNSTQALQDIALAATGTYVPLAQTFIAVRDGYFKDEGLNVNFQVIKPSAAAAALGSGSLPFIASACTDVVNLANQGVDVLAVAGLEHYLMLDLVVSKATMNSKHLSLDMPIEERFKALKGMTIAISGPGASTDVFLSWMLQKAGLDRTTDVSTLTAATHGERVAALTGGKVDGFLSGPPASFEEEQNGDGSVFISGSKGEIEELGKGFMYECLFTSKQYAEKNPEVVKKVVRAVLRGNTLIGDDTTAAIAAMQQDFNDADQKLLAKSLDIAKEGFTKDGRMAESQMKQLVAFFSLSGQVKGDIDESEGGFWTNKYLSE